MPGPTFVFAFVVSSLIAALFHLVVGGNAQRLALFMLVAWLGFATGQAFAVAFGVAIFQIGPLRMVAAVVSTFFLLLMAHIFTSGRTNRRRTRQR